MNTVKQDDEFDLIQLVEVLWAGKLVILALVSLSVAIGFSFTVYKKEYSRTSLCSVCAILCKLIQALRFSNL